MLSQEFYKIFYGKWLGEKPVSVTVSFVPRTGIPRKAGPGPPLRGNLAAPCQSSSFSQPFPFPSLTEDRPLPPLRPLLPGIPSAMPAPPAPAPYK
ncbi:hypothetical protein B4135_2347 [Caldibacillus debilis]|uniref:Uncharacterized protein n=1 Tax=Caldibacillus debilis TaxID=301148 RepID=A0A150M1F0_9BACI|nr:hypothetical protein B4135_2347 [Caldibacillus debilis]